MSETNTTTTINTGGSGSGSGSSKSKSSIFLSDQSEIKKVFDRFDTNGDGLISATELFEVMTALGSATSDEELSTMMSEMDADKDGFVSLSEFTEFCALKQDDSTELRDAFDMYDQDKNGLISAAELHLVLSRLGERCSVGDCERMIQSVDSDGDGNVDFDEFRKMMMRGSSSKVNNSDNNGNVNDTTSS